MFGTLEERFWAKVDKDGPVPTHAPDLGPCWLWIAARDWKTYGLIGTTVGTIRRVARAHRVSYEIAHGVTLTPEQVVLHRCDNPPCVRPEHLQCGTTADNMADMRAKGRHWLQLNPGDSPLARNRRYRQRLNGAASHVAGAQQTEEPLP